MYAAWAKSDHLRGEVTKQWNSSQQTHLPRHSFWSFVCCENPGNDILLQGRLHGLNQTNRPLAFSLHFAQKRFADVSSLQGASEHVCSYDGVLNRIVDADSPNR